MRWKKDWWKQAPEAIIVASIFLVYGIFAFIKTGGMFPVVFISIGLMVVVAALTYALRGARLRVEICDDRVIVRHYFKDQTIPLKGIRRVFRSVDATILETSSRDVVIDDSLFRNPVMRDATIKELQKRIGGDGTARAMPVQGKRDWWKQALEVVAIGIVASLFLIGGMVALRNAGGLLAVGFMIVGLIGVIAALTYALRGARLGVEICDDRVIVRHYFKDQTIPLRGIRRVFRSVDATILETSSRDVVIDDSLFRNPVIRDATIGELQRRMGGDR